MDLSNNTALTYLHSAENQLTSLDVSSNTALTDLHFSENQITILDVSNNTLLTLLSCADNQLTSLDVSNNTALAHIDCHENQLTSLDVSNNTSLTWLQCYGNQLTYLNMKNGITDALTTFHATNNDSLECIETLDPTYATENWTYADGNIDEGVIFEVHCIPYNFSPTDFSLREPSNNSQIVIDASNVDNGSITFAWEESTDENDDMLMYLMRATSREIGDHNIDTSAISFSVSYLSLIHI